VLGGQPGAFFFPVAFFLVVGGWTPPPLSWGRGDSFGKDLILRVVVAGPPGGEVPSAPLSRSPTVPLALATVNLAAPIPSVPMCAPPPTESLASQAWRDHAADLHHNRPQPTKKNTTLV